MATVTVARLRQDTADHLGDCKLGTATGGAAGSITDATRRTEATDYWAGAYVKIYSGTGSPQERCIASSTTGGVLNVEANWTATNPAASTLYELHKLMEAAEYDRWVRLAIEHLTHARKLVQFTVDESLTWVTDQYEYTAPSSIVGLYEVQVAQVAAPASVPGDWARLQNEFWSLRTSGATTKIAFDSHLANMTDTYKLRLLGYAEFSLPSADTDTYTFSSLPVTLLAASLAAESLVGRDPSNHYQGLADRLATRANQAMEEAMASYIHPQTRWVLPY